jgi:transcription elongation factor Elf1
MNKIKCPFCGDVHESYGYLKDDSVGKRYYGVMQLYCLSCGMPFEIKQSEFLGRWKVSEN